MSPEIFKNEPYSFKTDIWSLGIVLYEICALRKPFNAKSLPGLAMKITRGSYRPIPSRWLENCKKQPSKVSISIIRSEHVF